MRKYILEILTYSNIRFLLMEVAHPPFRNVPNVDSKPNFLLLQNFISISNNFLIVMFFLYISIYKLKKQSINFYSNVYEIGTE